MDEPFGALDPIIRTRAQEDLRHIQQRLGSTIMLVTHDMGVIAETADRVAVMYLGQIVEIGATRDLFDAPRHPYTRALMSAVPEPDPVLQRGKERFPLHGELPSPAKIPRGCAFHTRCPLATEICSQSRPELTPRPDGAFVACHHV